MLNSHLFAFVFRMVLRSLIAKHHTVWLLRW